jgi:hypothetical protein
MATHKTEAEALIQKFNVQVKNMKAYVSFFDNSHNFFKYYFFFTSELAVLSVNLKKVKNLAAQGEETKGTKRYYYNNNNNKYNNTRGENSVWNSVASRICDSLSKRIDHEGNFAKFSVKVTSIKIKCIIE